MPRRTKLGFSAFWRLPPTTSFPKRHAVAPFSRRPGGPGAPFPCFGYRSPPRLTAPGHQVITPGSDPAEAFQKIRTVMAETDEGVLLVQIRRYKPNFVALTDSSALLRYKKELVDILTAENLGDVGAYGGDGDKFVTKPGPLTGIRVGALGKVTSISASELARTTADD